MNVVGQIVNLPKIKKTKNLLARKMSCNIVICLEKIHILFLTHIEKCCRVNRAKQSSESHVSSNFYIVDALFAVKLQFDLIDGYISLLG